MADKIPDAKPTPKPGRSKKPKIREQDVVGLKYFDQLAPLLERLHEDGCQRDTAGNRKLHYDQYCMLILLFMFNPIVTSLRGIQQSSELAKVKKTGLSACFAQFAVRSYTSLQSRITERNYFQTRRTTPADLSR